MVRIESNRNLLEADEAANRQTGGNQQHERERDFRRDEPRTQAALTVRAAAARRLLEIVVDVDAAQLTRRCEPEEHAGGHGDHEREQQHGNIDADVAGDRQAARAQRDERADEPHGEQHAERAAERGEQHALGQQLHQNPSARRAKRHAQRDLLMAGARARDEQTRHVCGRDQQHETDGDEQERDHRPHVGDEIGSQRDEIDAGVLIVVREVALESERHRVHVGLRGCDRDARLEPTEDEEITVRPFGRRILGRSEQRIVRHAPVRRNPYFGAFGIGDLWRHDTDDRRRLAVEMNGASDDVGAAGESPAPRSVAQDGGARRARTLIGLGERSANRRGDLEHVEEIDVHHRAVEAFGVIAVG